MNHKSHENFPLASLMVENARNREPANVRKLIEAYCEAVDSGHTPDPPILEFLAEALGRILQGEKADVAFATKRDRPGRNKKPRPRRPDSLTTKRDWDLAVAVVKRLEARPRLTDGYKRVAVKHGVSVSTVQRAYTEWGPAVAIGRQVWTVIQSSMSQMLQRNISEGERTDAELKSLAQTLQANATLIGELEDAFASWGAWTDGLVTEELHQRARNFALHFCEFSGIGWAVNSTDVTPEAAWEEARDQPGFAGFMKLWTIPPVGHSSCLADESEIKAAWTGGFSRARTLQGGAQSRPEG